MKIKKAEAVLTVVPPCPHAVLVASWDSAQDMGREDRATRFMCEACNQEFTPEQAKSEREGFARKLVGQEEAEKT